MMTMKFATKSAAAFLAASLLLCGSTAFAHPGHTESDQAAKVQLTEEQKKELSVIHDEILAKKKELISKYVQFGVMSEEKAKEALEHMEERHAKLEKNGYIMEWHKKGKHK
jgi:hypothetical protein